MNTVTTKQPKSTYGFFNHFVISDEQKDTAARYGLSVKKLKGGDFEIASANGRGALQELLPVSHQLADDQDFITLKRKEMRKFLDFLRQPIAETLDKETRMTGHAISRFITTGHVEVHQFLDEGLASAASLECHLKGENKMKENDIWKNEPEFWNPDLNDQKVSSIPGTSYDPERGFVLSLNAAMSNRMAQLKPAQKKLRDMTKGALELVSGQKIENDQSEIALSAKQTQNFYKTVSRIPNIERVIKAARVEEKSAVKLKEVLKNADDLKTDARFQIAKATKQTRQTDAVKFDNLLRATSALKPIAGSDVIFDVWRDSFSTEHAMKLSDPVNNVFEEYEVFASVLNEMRDAGEITPEHMQATVHHFRKLMAFTADLLESMEEGADHKKVVKKHDAENRQGFKSGVSEVSAVFNAVSVNGVQAGELDGDYDELLSAVGNVLGQNGSMAKQQLMGYIDMMKGFWQGVGESAFDSPVVATMLVGFVGYAWYTKYGVDPQLTQLAADQMFDGLDFLNPDISSGVRDSLADAGQNVIDNAISTGQIDDCEAAVDCHYNYVVPPFMVDLIDDSVGQYLKFRHYVGSDIIASNANTAVNILPSAFEATYEAADIQINHDVVFRDYAEWITEQGGLFVVDANMFQDGSHASMLAYGITRASKNGFGAFQGMGGLAAEFFNPARRIIKSAVNPFARMGLSVGAATGMIGPERAAKMYRSTKPDFQNRLIESAMSSVSGASSRLYLDQEGTITATKQPEELGESMRLNIGWYGLKREKIELSDSKINDLEQRLNEFALVLKYSADDIGIESEPYTEFVQSALSRIENALKDYKQSGRCDRMQTLKKSLNGDLQHVIGAELKFNGRDELYRLFFDEPEQKKRGFLKRLFTETAEVKDNRRLNVLARFASKKEGRMMRTEWREDMRQDRCDAQNKYKKPERLASLQSLKYAWGEVGKYANKAKYSAAVALNHVWGGIVFTAREGIETPFCETPMKKRVATVFAAACLGGLAMDVAGVGNAVSDTFSAAAAMVSGITATGLIAGAINIPQDLALHTAAIGVSALAVGIPWYLTVNKGLKPISQGVRETLRRAPQAPSF